ncbi:MULTISPECIES: hypothetical protein [unclassified Haloparvum]|uniref:hypothetical protein n=1 Tax=Haloparvum sp. PAK95 TaxID=3418962 RepID=UPI003D2EB7B5
MGRELDAWVDEYWGWAAVSLFLLLSVDLLMTLYAAADVGIAHESNPVMGWLLTQSLVVLVGLHLTAVVLVATLFYGLVELVREAPMRHRRPLRLGIEVFLGLLVAAGLFVFANNLTVIVHGSSLV